MTNESARDGLALRRLRPYQQEVAPAILNSVFGRKGLTFSVEIARQGGKNELSAQLELLLLTLYMAEPKNLIKCSPTFKPQTVISIMRLKDRLNDAGFDGIWTSELGYIVRLGNARAIFLSADESLARLGAQRGLFVPFPMWMANSLTPFTYIDYDARPAGLHVFTFHAFPGELTIVKTQSIFELS